MLLSFYGVTRALYVKEGIRLKALKLLSCAPTGLSLQTIECFLF